MRNFKIQINAIDDHRTHFNAFYFWDTDDLKIAYHVEVDDDKITCERNTVLLMNMSGCVLYMKWGLVTKNVLI